MKRIVIVGGGIAGLSAAYYATKKLALSRAEGIPNAQITLIESSDRWGGKIVTERSPFNDGQFQEERAECKKKPKISVMYTNTQ